MVSAQDILVTHSGDVIKAYETEVGPTSVYFKGSDSADTPLQKIALSELLVIKYEDGRKLVVGEDSVHHQSVSQNTTIASEDQENDRLISEKNSVTVSIPNGNPKKKASVLFCQCKVLPESILANSEVEMSIVSTCYRPDTHNPCLVASDNAFLISLKNKTDRTIYVDLGNSFVIRGNVSSVCYVPSTTSTGTSSSVASSISIPVAGAMLGRSTSTFSSTSVSTQRIAAIPPKSEQLVVRFDLFPVGSEYAYNDIISIDTKNYPEHPRLSLYLQNDELPSIGEIKTVDPGPLSFGVVLAFAYDESQQNQHSIKAGFAVDKYLGAKFDANWSRFFLDLRYISPNYSNALFFIARAR